MFVDTEERKHGEVQAPAKVLDEPAKLLLRAAELIEQYGHTKRDPGHRSRGFCITGALCEVGATGEPWKRLAAQFGGCGMNWVQWNNAPERTKAEVVAKLREVALS